MVYDERRRRRPRETSRMFGARETEVLVVGAGPVGLFSALSLARHGVRVQIVDEQFRTAAHSYALALHSSSLGLLHEAGVAEKLE